MPNIDDEIRSQIAAFTASLTSLVRQAALESVTAALGGSGASTTVAAPAQAAATRGRGRPKKVAQATPITKAAAAPAVKAAAPAPKATATAKAAPTPAPKAGVSKKPAVHGEKRPPAELAKLTERLGEYIKAHPGLRIEPIGKALGTPTKELSLPIKKLLAGKKIRSEGQKRATEYFAA